MKVKFWGVRGSLPAPITTEDIEAKLRRALGAARELELPDTDDDSAQAAIRDFIAALPFEVRGTVGGNTPCVQIIPAEGEIIIVDAGSGIRALGAELMKGDFARGKGHAHIFISHTHWDHISGLPFFQPIYVKGNRIDFYGGHKNLEERISYQQDAEHFPIGWEKLASDRRINIIETEQEFNIGATGIVAHRLSHPGDSYSYKFTGEGGGTIIYASDAEYKHLDRKALKEHIRFFENADILIFDTQYSLSDAFAKEEWGHSSVIIGMEAAAEAKVKHLVMFHHDPAYTDDELVSLLERAEQYREILRKHKGFSPEVHLGWEGLVLEVSK